MRMLKSEELTDLSAKMMSTAELKERKFPARGTVYVKSSRLIELDLFKSGQVNPW